MIDEKKLIMTIANWQNTLMPGWSSANDTDTVIYNTLEEMIGLIESQPPADQWIPTAERLPEKRGIYIVTGSWKDEPRKIWLCEFLILDSICSGWCNDAKNPIVEAWQPLPEPWEE